MNYPISRKNVNQMFDNIAGKYDFINHFLSIGIDYYWRKEVVKAVKLLPCNIIADFATGTGDLAIALATKIKSTKIYGIDFSSKMLEIAEKKSIKKGVSNIITFRQENCEETTLDSNSIDIVTIGFGIRNFNKPEKGLAEMYRVIKPGGNVIILEFSTPYKGAIAYLVKQYYNYIIPFVGKLFAGNKGAYTYLPKTIYEFPNGANFCKKMQEAGFSQTHFKSMTFNLVNIYFGKKG